MFPSVKSLLSIMGQLFSSVRQTSVYLLKIPQSSIIKIQFILKAKDFFSPPTQPIWVSVGLFLRTKNIHDRVLFKKKKSAHHVLFCSKGRQINMVLRVELNTW